MFYNSNSNDSQIIELINRRDVRLSQILAIPSIITDVQSYNDELVHFLIRDEYLTEMLETLIVTPEPNDNGIIYFDVRHTISEILSSYVEDIYNTVSGNDRYLNILFKPFTQCKLPATDQLKTQSDNTDTSSSKSESNEQPQILSLNSVTCSLILKVAKILCAQAQENMIMYFRKHPNIIDGLIDNIDYNAVSDFLAKFIQSIPMKSSSELSSYRQFLSDQNFVDKVLSKISLDINSEPASLKCLQILTDIMLSIRSSKDTHPLKEYLENVTVVNKILDIVLNVPYSRTTFISTGFAFLKSLFELPERYSQNLDQSSPTPPYSSFQVTSRTKLRHIMNREDVEANAPTIMPILDAICNRFEHFKTILSTNVTGLEIKTVYGGVIKSPLGPHRLAILELLDRLVELEQTNITKSLVDCDFVALLLKFLSDYPLNTLLYRVTINIINRLIVFTLSKVDSPNVHLKRCSSILIKYLFHDLKLIPKLIQMWKETDSNIPGSTIRIRSLYRMFAAVLFTTILNYSLSTELTISILTPEVSLDTWTNFCDTEIQEYNRQNDPETNLPNSPSEESGYNVPEDYSRLYEMCLISKFGSDFPNFSHLPIVTNIPVESPDINSNPLPNLFITTPEDRDNADNFEQTCNHLLSARNPNEREDEDDHNTDDDDDDNNGATGEDNPPNNAVSQNEPASNLNGTNRPANVTYNLSRTIYLKSDVTEFGDPDSEQVQTPSYNHDDDGNAVASEERGDDAGFLSTQFLDELFEEVNKESCLTKLNTKESGNFSHHIFPSDKLNNKPKVPRLIFNPSITSNPNPKPRPMPMLINTNSNPVSAPQITREKCKSLDDDKPELAEDIHEDHIDEIDTNEPELKSSFSRFIAYNDDDDNDDDNKEIDGDDDDNDSDDIPLSSRLEKERSVTSENLSEVDKLLDNKIWNSPSNSVNNLNLTLEDDVKESSVSVTVDTVVNVTPTIEHANAKVSPEVLINDSDKLNSDIDQVNDPDIRKNDEVYVANTNNEFLSENTVFKDNPFSPKLERFTIPAQSANAKKTSTSFNSKQSLVYESNKFIKLTDSGNFIGSNQLNHQSHLVNTNATAAVTSAIITNYNKVNSKLHTSNSRIKLNSPGKKYATTPTQYTTSTCIKSISSSVISPIPWTSFQTSHNRSTSAPNKLITHNSSQDSISNLNSSNQSPQSIDRLPSLSETNVEPNNIIAKPIPNGDVNK